ncbi:MAG: CPBP family intramembrane metalloprotease [Prevotellaceae bacterium]|jgi:membrane protease YdiL (CAAX protease family)|nr:CPBP family intramembrane metalloprotease [Prevotellaceae bacterium]
MLKAIFEKDSCWIKSIFIIIVPLVFSILFIGISYGVSAIFHVSDEAVKLKLMQLFSATGMFICSSFVLAYLFSSHIRQFLLLRKPDVRMIILAALSMLAAIPLINFIGNLNNLVVFPESLKFAEEFFRAYEEKLAILTEQLLTSGDSFSGLALNLLVMAIIPALGEELLFRGVIQNSIAKSLKSKIWAIWITAFLFSAIHFQFYGFIPRLLLGAYFGYLLVWSQSIWIPIAAHFTNNATIVLFYFFLKGKEFTVDLETVGATGSPQWMTGSILLFALIVLIIVTSLRQTKSRTMK